MYCFGAEAVRTPWLLVTSISATKLGGGLEEFCVSLYGGADDEGVGVAELGGEAVLNLVGRDYVPAGLLLEDGEGGVRDFFGENDLQG